MGLEPDLVGVTLGCWASQCSSLLGLGWGVRPGPGGQTRDHCCP